jgi:tetratricopeptide (TPR) repeat protein
MPTESADGKNRADIQSMVLEMISADDPQKRSGLATAILGFDPKNPAAKYVTWQELDDEASMERMDLLYEAIETLRPSIKSHEETVDENDYSLFLSMLSDLSSFLYFRGEKERAFEAAQELVDLDSECYIAGRIVYYSILVERGEYRKTVDAVEADMCETPIASYCRAIALYELEGPSTEASDAVVEAISLDPDMAFYITGMWAFDDEDMEGADDEDGYMDELMMQSAILSELWAATEERLAFLSVIVFAFGYLTGRVEDASDIGMLEDGYRTLGCLDDMTEARDTIQAMLADGKDQADVDDEALFLFKDMRERGVFS